MNNELPELPPAYFQCNECDTGGALNSSYPSQAYYPPGELRYVPKLKTWLCEDCGELALLPEEGIKEWRECLSVQDVLIKMIGEENANK